MKNINKEIMLNIDKIYICHWSKLSNRKEKLIEHLSTLGISDYEWVEVYDKDNWDLIEIVKQYTKIFEAEENGRLLKISEISSAIGSRSSCCSSLAKVLLILLIAPILFKGKRTIRDCSANACKILCLIHQTA